MSGFDNDTVYANNVDFSGGFPVSGKVTANGQLLIGSTASPNIRVNTLTQGTGITITNGSGTITIAANGANDLHTAKFIVSSEGTTGTGANFTTITAAIASAQGTGINSTIFIMPGLTGTYTENFSLPAGINLAAYNCDATTPNVTIIGKITCSTAGSRSISGIRLQTNSDNFLVVSGSVAAVINLNNCYLNMTNNTGISFTAASTSSAINISNCMGNLGTTGIAIFALSGTGTLTFRFCQILNSGGSTTASTVSSGSVTLFFSIITNPITSSSTGGITFDGCEISTAAQNTTTLTVGGTGATVFINSYLASGSASTITIATTCAASCTACTIDSSNTNAITGLGTIIYSLLDFPDTSSLINTTTQTRRNINTGGISFDGGTNVLSNYTVGTFTPTWTGQSATGVTTYVTQVGYYIRIGASVQVQTTLTISAATGTGNILLGALPFTIKNQTSGTPIGPLTDSTITYPALTTSPAWSGIINGTNANMICSGTATANQFAQMENASRSLLYNATYEI